MNLTTRVLCPLAGSVALLLNPVHAVDIQKLNNLDSINLGTSWNGDIVPGSEDVALFDSAISVPFSVAMTGDLAWQGIRLTSVSGTRNAANNVSIRNGSSANTLSLGSGGVDMSAALHALAIQSRVTLTASQVWNVANANTNGNPSGLSQNEDLAFLGQAANLPFNLGGFSVEKIGAGTAAIHGGYTISNGTFNVNGGVLHIQGGGNRVTTVDSSVAFNVGSATLRFAAQSGAGGVSTQVNAPITLNAGSTLTLHLNNTNAINLTGNITATGNHTWSVIGGNTGALTTFSGSLIGEGNITYTNTNTNAAGVLRMSGNNSGYTGTFTVNGASGTRAIRLSGPNAGSANATWSVAAGNTLQVDGQSVQLGTLAGAGTISNSHASNLATINVRTGSFSGAITNGATGATALTKIGPDTLLLTGANSYTGTTLVSAGTLLTTPAHTGSTNVTVADGATFGVTLTGVGASFSTGTLLSGSVTGSTLRFDTGTFGNPVAPVIAASTFTPAAPTRLNVLGNNLSAGTFTLLNYVGGLGVGGFGQLNLILPFRVAGSLVDNTGNTSIDVNITGVDTPKWRGNVNGTWDIDPDNTGATGVPNWATSTTLVATRYVEGAVGVDSVIFDDSATGTRNVNLATTLSPLGILVNSSGPGYTFEGPGKISGTGPLIKQGAGVLTIANTATNDYSGGTTITSGTLRLGDGVTAGAGLVSGPITNHSMLILEHADNQTLTANITGTGSLVKLGPATTILTGTLSYAGPTNATAGVLALNSPSTLANAVTIDSGGTLRLDHATGTVSSPITNNGILQLNSTASMNAPISGSGGILVDSAGTKTIGGTAANTFTGTSTVTGGTLNLAKNNGGIGAVGISGDLVINGGAVTVGALGDQFADTSNITVNSGSLNTANRVDTIASLTVNASTPVSTLSGLNVTGSITITAGAQHDIVNSGGTTSANAVLLSNTNVRLGINSGPSVLNVGPGGLSLTNASIVYGSAGNAAQTGTVNLNGNVTASGFSAFDVNSGNPISRIDLGAASRTFNVVDGITTVEGSIVSSTASVGLIKSGDGTLLLAPGTNTNGENAYTGPTIISDGVLLVNGTLTGSTVIADGGTLGGTGTITPSAQGVILEATGQLSPGTGPFTIGTLTVNGVFDVFGSITDAATAALQFDMDTPFTSDRVVLPTGTLTIGVGKLEFDDFLFTPVFGFTDLTTYPLFETNSPIIGSFGPNTVGSINGLAAQIQLSEDGTDLVLMVPEPGCATLLLGGLALVSARRRRSGCSAA